MTIEQATEICSRLNDGLNEARVHEEYSGRGFKEGESVVGIVYDGSPVQLGHACNTEGVPPADLPTRTDCMGRSGTIYY